MSQEDEEELQRLRTLVHEQMAEIFHHEQENSRLKAQVAKLNTQIGLAEGNMGRATEHMDQLHAQMELIHKAYTARIRARETDALGEHRGPLAVEDKAWEPN